MGMTIDEIIQGIEVIQAQAEWDYPLDWQIVLDGAIDIICKYQKIADLYDYWRSNKCEYTISCMENIGKVLRGGDNGK